MKYTSSDSFTCKKHFVCPFVLIKGREKSRMNRASSSTSKSGTEALEVPELLDKTKADYFF